MGKSSRSQEEGQFHSSAKVNVKFGEDHDGALRAQMAICG